MSKTKAEALMSHGADVTFLMSTIARDKRGYLRRIPSYFPFIKGLLSRWSVREVVWLCCSDICLIGTLFLYFNKKKIIVWDVTDLHKLQLGSKFAMLITQSVERVLSRKASFIVLSSPAFFEQYYNSFVSIEKVYIIENFVMLKKARTKRKATIPPFPPIRLLYAGIFRSERILSLLGQVAKQGAGVCTVVLAGKPYLTIKEALFRQVVSSEGVIYSGPYLSDELPELYKDVHVAVGLVDMELDPNEGILLPNRLYQAGAFGRPLLTTTGSYTAKIAAERKIGIEVNNDPAEIIKLLTRLACTDVLINISRNLPDPREFVYSGQYRPLLDQLCEALGRIDKVPA